MKVECGVVGVHEEHCDAASGSKAGLLVILDLIGTRCSFLESANPLCLVPWYACAIQLSISDWDHRDVLLVQRQSRCISKAGHYGSNPRVTDITLRFRTIGGEVYTGKAYEPLLTKILARWPYNPGQSVWQNADNMINYGLVKYV